ncbi:MAG: thiamine pyrophosphate-dependent enzyme [Steroidobacteraceae bacterium]
MSSQPATLSSAQAIVDGLVRNGIRTLFGIPGVHTYQLFEALYERREEIRFVGTRHEQGAAYMAYGYAKSTGLPAAYTCVPGPGMLNTTAALCTAYAGNAPVLCVTSEIPSNEIGQGHGILHELPDQLGTLKSLTKWAGRINHPTEAHAVVNTAFQQMLGGRRGPVAIECPWDTLGQSAAVVPEESVPPAAAPPPDPAGIARAAALIAAAKNPMIMLGSGAIGACAEVNALAELLQCPATAHRSGRGIVGDDTPHGLNCAAAYDYWLGCDVLIAIGTRMELQFLRWRKMPENVKIVRIDIDPREMVRRKADVGLVTDARAGTVALLAALAPLVQPRAARTAEFAALKQAARVRYEASVQPQVGYLDVIREVLPRDGLFVEEICQMGFTARFAFPVYAPNTYISCAYQDNLGFGYMTALGAKVAHPDKAVVSINGDGGFMFGVQELATAVQHGINVVAIVFNNRSFGNVVRDQKFAFKGHHIGDRLVNPDFTALARSFGALAYTVRNPEELRPVLTEALAANAPVLIEVLGEPGSEGSPWPFLHPWATY